ncbi:MAG: ComEA family DNA-binding protein [Gammaproteobacteria bacterium]
MKNVVQLLIAMLFCLVSTFVFAEPVNVNTASAEDIAKALNGIGLVKAEAIIKDRDANGPFKSADDLKRVKGIGDATVNSNKELILVE